MILAIAAARGENGGEGTSPDLLSSPAGSARASWPRNSSGRMQGCVANLCAAGSRRSGTSAQLDRTLAPATQSSATARRALPKGKPLRGTVAVSL